MKANTYIPVQYFTRVLQTMVSWRKFASVDLIYPLQLLAHGLTARIHHATFSLGGKGVL
jgi:hypothetical protein